MKRSRLLLLISSEMPKMSPWLFWLLMLLGSQVLATPRSLQPLIDATPVGGTLRLAPGIYLGPASIRHSMSLEGAHQAVIQGKGRSTVLRVAANGVTLRGLRLRGSEDSQDRTDAGLQLEGSEHRIEDNDLEDVLFGVHLKGVNRFDNNLTTVAISAPGAGSANLWSDNQWDDYQGFDRDRNQIGDTPHDVMLCADRIWMETPQAGFFRNTPAFELLDFLERLAPFSSPHRVLQDARPRM